MDTRQKNDVIAQIDAETGELQGYTYLLKGKEGSPSYFHSAKAGKEFILYQRDIMDNPSIAYNKLKEIAKEHDWKVRFVPAKGYHFSKREGNFEKIKGVEKIVAISPSMVGFLIVLYSLGSMTGFAISQINQVKLNYPLLTGIIITLVGLIYAKRVLR